MSAARPETGATDAAAYAMYLEDNRRYEGELIDEWDKEPDTLKEHYRRFATAMIAGIEGNHMRIALAEHVVDAADREAIGRAAALVRIGKRMPRPLMTNERLTLFIEMWNAAYAITDDDLARLERLGSGGAGRGARGDGAVTATEKEYRKFERDWQHSTRGSDEEADALYGMIDSLHDVIAELYEKVNALVEWAMATPEMPS